MVLKKKLAAVVSVLVLASLSLSSCSSSDSQTSNSTTPTQEYDWRKYGPNEIFYTENLQDVSLDNKGWYGNEDDLCQKLTYKLNHVYLPFWLTVQEPEEQAKLRRLYEKEHGTLRSSVDCFGYGNDFPYNWYYSDNGNPILIEYNKAPSGNLSSASLASERDRELNKIKGYATIPDFDGVYNSENPRKVVGIMIQPGCRQLFEGDPSCGYQYSVILETHNASAPRDTVGVTLNGRDFTDYNTFSRLAGLEDPNQEEKYFLKKPYHSKEIECSEQKSKKYHLKRVDGSLVESPNPGRNDCD